MLLVLPIRHIHCCTDSIMLTRVTILHFAMGQRSSRIDLRCEKKGKVCPLARCSGLWMYVVSIVFLKVYLLWLNLKRLTFMTRWNIILDRLVTLLKMRSISDYYRIIEIEYVTHNHFKRIYTNIICSAITFE